MWIERPSEIINVELFKFTVYFPVKFWAILWHEVWEPARQWLADTRFRDKKPKKKKHFLGSVNNLEAGVVEPDGVLRIC
jgi:hypothetical protein